VAIERRSFLKGALAGIGGAAAAGAGALALLPQARGLFLRTTRPRIDPPIADPGTAEVLYNGIVLPSPWPPPAQHIDRTAATAPYLVRPPDVIPIDVGRQLFVDDFLIEECELDRSYHTAQYIADNPILSPTLPWERFSPSQLTADPNPSAMPFSDGVVYDPVDSAFKMWYSAAYNGVTCYATSDDGRQWRKPSLDVVPGTNIVFDRERDSASVWLDHDANAAPARFKMLVFTVGGRRLLRYTSPDGVHWTPAGYGGPSGDRSTVFFNPFRQRWIYSLRDDDEVRQPVGRYRRYVETPEFASLTPWTHHDAVAWIAGDDSDPPRPGLRFPPELYNLDCVAYESVLLGLFTMFYGDPPDREKPNQIGVGFSRDGFHWTRPMREPFIPVSERRGDWNWANVQSAGGCCLVVGDRLHFYVSGRAGVPGTGDPGVCTTGLATLRRDGFVSLDATGDDRGSTIRGRRRSVTTRPVRFSGGSLFVNVDAARGSLAAEVVETDGRVRSGFSVADCVPVNTDSTRAEVRWTGASIADLAGDTLRFRFYLDEARLFAFWVAPDRRGASRGYRANGGPGIATPLDL
jgi:hypothetical protein